MIKDPASLEYQTAIIPLRQGVDLKTAVQVVDAPALLNLRNVTMHAPGELSKDRGYPLMSTNDLAGAALPTPFRRFIEHNSAQLIMTRDNLAERSETADLFHAPPNRTAIASSAAERQIAQDSNAVPFMVDYASVGGFEMHAVLYQGASLRIRVREISTGTVMSTLNVAVTPVLGQHPRCMVSGVNLVCLWADVANLRATRWSASAPTTPLSAPVNLAVNVNAAAKWIDAVGGAATGYVAYTTTVPTVVVQRFNPATLALVGAAAGIAGTALDGIAVCLDATENQLVAWCGAPGLSVFGLTPAGAARGNSLLLAGIYDAPACVSNENATGRGTVFASQGAVGGAVRHQCAFTGVGGSLATATLFGWRPCHKPVLIDALIWIGYIQTPAVGTPFSENTAVTVVHRADNGSVSTADPVCSYLYGTLQTSDTPSAANQAPVASIFPVGTEYRWAWIVIDPLTPNEESGGVALLKLRPYDGQAAPLRRMPVLCNAIANGQTGFFDASFVTAPVILNGTQQNVAGGLVPGLTYTYIAFYELKLPDGTVVVSPVSRARAELITGLNDQVTLTITTPLFREGLTAQVRVARTLGDGTVFHVLTPGTNADARTASTVTVVDGSPDAAIDSLRLLYTTGGVLEAFPAPMSRVLTLHQGRLFAVDENSNQLRYTRSILDGEAPAWHPNLSVDCTGTNMDPRALVTSPSGLWVLGRDRLTGAGAIALLLGTGPDDTGSGSTYELQRLENADVGPAFYKHAVSTPLGILFDDPNQGLHLLPTGGGAPVFVGAPVRTAQGQTVAMHVMQDRKEVRIVQSNGSCSTLVWHYDQNQWSLRGNANPGLTDAAVWDGRPVLMVSNLLARQENGMWLDPLAGYQVMSLTTAWIKTAGFSGLQRIWRLYLLGRNFAPHGLSITLQYDYNDTAPGDVYTFTEAEVTAAVATGKYEFRISPRKQLCEAFRVTITDSAGSSGNGQGAAWTALRLEYGALRASSRKASTARKS